MFSTLYGSWVRPVLLVTVLTFMSGVAVYHFDLVGAYRPELLSIVVVGYLILALTQLIATKHEYGNWYIAFSFLPMCLLTWLTVSTRIKEPSILFITFILTFIILLFLLNVIINELVVIDGNLEVLLYIGVVLAIFGVMFYTNVQASNDGEGAATLVTLFYTILVFIFLVSFIYFIHHAAFSKNKLTLVMVYFMFFAQYILVGVVFKFIETVFRNI